MGIRWEHQREAQWGPRKEHQRGSPGLQHLRIDVFVSILIVVKFITLTLGNDKGGEDEVDQVHHACKVAFEFEDARRGRLTGRRIEKLVLERETENAGAFICLQQCIFDGRGEEKLCIIPSLLAQQV